MRPVIVFASLLFLLFAGCNDNQNVDVNLNAHSQLAQLAKEDLMIPIAPKRATGNLDRNERKAQVAGVVPFVKVINSIKKEKDWQAAHKVVSTQLQVYREHPQHHVIEQLAGNIMLRRYLLKEELTPTTLDAISFYTELLVKNNHEDASVLAPAFSVLRGRWPSTKLAAAIENTKAAAFAWLNRTTPCADCPPQSSLAKFTPVVDTDAMKRRALEVREALSQLDDLYATIR